MYGVCQSDTCVAEIVPQPRIGSPTFVAWPNVLQLDLESSSSQQVDLGQKNLLLVLDAGFQVEAKIMRRAMLWRNCSV